MFNAFELNCFNLVDTCNIALILFLKCEVTKLRIPPSSLVTQCHTSSTLSAPLNVWRNLWMYPYQGLKFCIRVSYVQFNIILVLLCLLYCSYFPFFQPQLPLQGGFFFQLASPYISPQIRISSAFWWGNDSANCLPLSRVCYVERFLHTEFSSIKIKV